MIRDCFLLWRDPDSARYRSTFEKHSVSKSSQFMHLHPSAWMD